MPKAEKFTSKTIIALAFCLFSFLQLSAQIPATKYPSLLWEITGNGLSKPSYLFGTMHVSSKLVFNLPDSFYYGIKQVQVVALENNPENWQQEMDKYNFSNLGSMDGLAGGKNNMTNDYLNVSDVQFKPFTTKLAWALSSTPNVLNSLLYRSYGMSSTDFEEDTYLDMYIYQIGKKLQKKIAGVEDFKKSMQMTTEASLDMMAERNKKIKSYGVDEDFNFNKLSEAYRTGNLDWLDTINKVNSRSDAYDEKFLYLRNDIQANSIDSIIKSGSSLFVGVGAAHLPGQRGVIEQLRRKGYTLRPVHWGERSGVEKDRIDNIRIPINFAEQTAPDKFYTVKTPGTLYNSKNQYTSLLGTQASYADMGNGSYYVVTRIQTNAAIMGLSDKDVASKLDSLLYENIPGKIISKVNVVNNGYQGLDIINRTRRGDIQRYRIFITPFEVLLFKMSGIGDYIFKGSEADSFFRSITLKPLDNKEWANYTPKNGGFSVNLPGIPTSFTAPKNTIFGIADTKENVQYAIIRNDINNYGFVGEDSFDLNLLHESFSSADIISKTVRKEKSIKNGYPIMDAKYRDKKNDTYQCRYIIQGPHYYALIAHYKNPSSKSDSFFNSFQIKPIILGDSKTYTDSSLAYTVKTTFFPKDELKDNDLLRDILDKYKQMSIKLDDNEYDTSKANVDIWEGIFESKNIKNDSTGENILVSYSKPARYFYDKDSIAFKRIINGDKKMEDSTWIVREKKVDVSSNNVYSRYTVYSAKNSSRTLMTKVFYKNGITHTLMTEGDTLTPSSSFVQQFFENFQPIYNTSENFNPFEKKSTVFFKDYFSADSTVRKRALRFAPSIFLDKEDLPNIKKAIQQLSWKQDKKYMNKKTIWLKKIGTISSPEATAYLKKSYTNAIDTTELQNSVLSALLAQKTQQSFNTYKEIVSNDPPVVMNTDNYRSNVATSYSDLGSNPQDKTILSYDEITGGLYDSLQLTKSIYAELLPLINLDDYKWKLMDLTTTLLDSNKINSSDYKIYFSKFLLEGKQELKKELALEKKSVIDAASRTGDNDYESENNSKDGGNQQLNTYAKLLLPFYDTNPKVRDFFKQLLNAEDKKLQLDTYILLLQNNKKMSDSFANALAENDAYRFRLYQELSKIDKLNFFPSKYNNHIQLGKSELLSLTNYYGKPDSIVYIGEQKTTLDGKTGNVYFFKYKLKKDDFGWKLAMAGLTPLEPKEYRFSTKENLPKKSSQLKSSRTTTLTTVRRYASWKSIYDYPYSLTKYTTSSLKKDIPQEELLDKELTKLLITKQKSGELFYLGERDYNYGLGY